MISSTYMSADLAKEPKNLSCLIKSRAGIKQIERAAFCDGFMVKSSCSVSGIQNSTVNRLSASVPQEIQSSLKKKIGELRSSFVSAEDSNVAITPEAPCKDAVIIHPSNFTVSNTVLTTPEITHGEFQFSSSLKGEQYLASISAQKPVSYSHKSQCNNFLKAQSNYNLKPQKNDEGSKTKSKREHHSQENHCTASLSSTSQDRNNRCSKKLKKSHSFELSNETSYPINYRTVNRARNSSSQSFKKNPAKSCSVLTSKPENLHCRFKKQFSQLHSSFFPEEERCSASSEGKIHLFPSSERTSCKAIKKITSVKPSTNALECTKLGTAKVKPPLEGINVNQSFTEYSLPDSAVSTDNMGINALSEASYIERFSLEATLKEPSYAVVKLDDARTDTSSVDMTVTHSGSTGKGNEGTCCEKSFFSDCLATSKRKKNYDSESNSKARLTNLISQVSIPADNCEKVTFQANILSNFEIQKMNFSQPEQERDSLHIRSQNERIMEADSSTNSNQSEALCMSVEKDSSSISQRSCDNKLNLNNLSPVMPDENEVKPCLTPRTSFNLSATDQDIELKKNEWKYLQPKNVECSNSKFKRPFPSVEPKISGSFLKNCGSKSDHKEDAPDLALLLADLADEFSTQPGTVARKETDEANFADSRESPTLKFSNAQQTENQIDGVLNSKSVPSSTSYEIPYLTIKKGGPENETGSFRALVKLFIVDLFRMTPTFRRNHYMFHNLIVHRVDIFGVVTGVRSVGDDKIIYEVDDGSGTISCMHRTTKQVTRLKELKNFLHQTENNEILNQTDDTILNESSIQPSSQEIALKQLRICMENHLAAIDEELFYKTGDTVHTKGVLYDYRDTISFYIYSIRKVKNVAEEIDRHLQMAVLYKSIYPKSIKGFKT